VFSISVLSCFAFGKQTTYKISHLDQEEEEEEGGSSSTSCSSAPLRIQGGRATLRVRALLRNNNKQL